MFVMDDLLDRDHNRLGNFEIRFDFRLGDRDSAVFRTADRPFATLAHDVDIRIDVTLRSLRARHAGRDCA